MPDLGMCWVASRPHSWETVVVRDECVLDAWRRDGYDIEGPFVPVLRAERAENALRDIAVIGVGTMSARDDALEMQRIARKALNGPQWGALDG